MCTHLRIKSNSKTYLAVAHDTNLVLTVMRQQIVKDVVFVAITFIAGIALLYMCAKLSALGY